MSHLELQLRDECKGLIDVIRDVVANWEKGDLANAVNNARETADAVEDFIVNNCGDDDILLWFTSSSGHIELQMTLDQARSASHSGSCDADVLELSKDAYIAAQLEKIKRGDLRYELKEYGAWDDKELSDHDQNLQRILWLAAGDIVDSSSNRE